MKYIWGLLFLAWGTSMIFNFNFDFGKYVFPLILIGIGINIILNKDKRHKSCRKNRDEKGEDYDK